MELFVYLLIGILLCLTSMQFNIKSLLLLFKPVNHKKRFCDYLSFISGVLMIIFFVTDTYRYGLLIFIACSLSSILSVFFVWSLSKLNSCSKYFTIFSFLIPFAIIAWYSVELDIFALSSFSIVGFYYRNNPFGAPFRKMFLLKDHKHKILKWEETGMCYNDIDFSFAGCFEKCSDLPHYNVIDYGIIPNSNEDVLTKVQNLIDDIGSKGGGVIYFPKGKFYFNKKKNGRDFIKINYSNIILEGECNGNNEPLTHFVNCQNTLETRKNPWLSPFFITTGEDLQCSNMFWGLQFLKKKNVITKSASMSDPGSDGKILEPTFLSNLISDSKKGDNVIYVEDTSILTKYKYLLIGLYNTSDDGNLIKSILGVDELRNEWKTALRAGEEQAPSYQLLVQISQILDEHRVKLTRPLFRDLSMIYIPKVFGVELLENVHLKNLCIESKWNGIFKHHGYPRYYSVYQAQEMDYGWNAINFKRVAHSSIDNVIIKDFTNPLYVLDSKNVTVSNVKIKGEDGHQGIKLYEHCCDCIVDNVIFYSHFADMLGGEGNAYGNVFKNISYENPFFNPVDFDFHGFSEGPMSPPSDNLFVNISGFRNIKGAGAIYNQPACAQNNIWVNWIRTGNLPNESYFYNIHYVKGSNALPIEEHCNLFKNSLFINVIE